MSTTATVRFSRTERSGKTFEVTATATFTRVAVTPANVSDWQALADFLGRPRTTKQSTGAQS